MTSKLKEIIKYSNSYVVRRKCIQNTLVVTRNPRLTSASYMANSSHVAMTEVYKHHDIPQSIRIHQPRRFLNLIALTKQPLLLRSEVRIERHKKNVTLNSCNQNNPSLSLSLSLSLSFPHARTHAHTPFLTNQSRETYAPCRPRER